MAPHPVERVSIGCVFQDVGLDMLGPFQLSAGVKRSVIIFVCLRTRAIHLEVTHCQSTHSFLNCLMRFKARRPGIRSIWSDCGTNFRGACPIVQKALDTWRKESKDAVARQGL